MPALTRADVEHVARLARLDLDEATIDKMTGQLNDILAHMDKLGQLDTEGVPPTTHAMEVVNRFREDRVRPSLDPETAVANAPEKDGQTFVVPRVI